jgi:CHAT domain-containing protein
VSDLRAADPWLEGLSLGALPRARAEASGLVRRVGGTSLLRAGPEATERFLKDADLNRYGLLHLAAHAVVDYDRPERSAIILAPGAAEEDGFLQAREIAGLDLDGKVVILSACRSASGEVISGEGVLGLGRAFFVAGARAVIGNLWPMRDEDAEAFVRGLSRGIARGDTLAAAMQSARQRRIAAGAPAAAWAGVVLLGDGDLVPIPGGRVILGWPVWTLLAAVMILGAVLGWWALRRRQVSS